MSDRLQPWTVLSIGLILAISAGGMWLLKKSTPYGLGINTDSVYYVNGARNILTGNGFYRNSGEDILKPITHFPPLFAYLLSAVGLTGIDPLRGGRLVIILLYGVNPILLAWLVWKLTRSHWLAILGAGLMAFSSVNLREYSVLMSEPLYLCLMLISFIVAYDYFSNRKTIYILLLGILSGLMYSTRYIGLSLLITWLIGICLFLPIWSEKLRHAGLLLSTSLPFVIAIMVRNYVLTGSTGNRNFLLHWAPFDKLASGIQCIWGWFLPSRTLTSYSNLEWGFIALFILLLLGALGILVWRMRGIICGRSYSPRENLLFMFALHGFVYLMMVYVTMNFFDATTVFDERMLLPVYLIVLLFIIAGLGTLWVHRQIAFRLVMVTTISTAVGFSVAEVIRTSAGLSLDGQGFNTRYFRESQTMQYLREHEVSVFYTNQPPIVYIITGKSGYMVPSPVDTLKMQPREQYQYDLAVMKDKINQQDGLLIFFYINGYEIDPWYLDLTAGLVPIESYPDAIIWGRID